jgi:hypothetical protein
MVAEINALSLQLALTKLSKHIGDEFPKVLPFTLYTIGGAVMITVVGNRMTTEDVDVSVVLALKRYGSVYPNIQDQLKMLVEKVWEEMERDGFPMHESWMNWAVDLVLPDGIISHKSRKLTPPRSSN